MERRAGTSGAVFALDVGTRKVAGLGSRVRVTLGPGAPTVVEVENRLGSTPLPSPSVSAAPSRTASIPVRRATTDICS